MQYTSSQPHRHCRCVLRADLRHERHAYLDMPYAADARRKKRAPPSRVCLRPWFVTPGSSILLHRSTNLAERQPRSQNIVAYCCRKCSGDTRRIISVSRQAFHSRRPDLTSQLDQGRDARTAQLEDTSTRAGRDKKGPVADTRAINRSSDNLISPASILARSDRSRTRLPTDKTTATGHRSRPSDHRNDRYVVSGSPCH